MSEQNQPQTEAVVVKGNGNGEPTALVRAPAQPDAPQVTAAQARIESVARALEKAYANASSLQLTQEEATNLAADFPDEAFRLGAGGDDRLIYIEHAYLRERLNTVLGVGAVVPIRRREWTEEFTYTDKYNKTQEAVRVYVDLVLLVRGCLVGEAVGDAVYYRANEKTNFSDALESAKSTAFRRCCKEFGVGLQAWKKGWGEGWKQRNPGQGSHGTAYRAPVAEPQARQAPAKASTPPPASAGTSPKVEVAPPPPPPAHAPAPSKPVQPPPRAQNEAREPGSEGLKDNEVLMTMPVLRPAKTKGGKQKWIAKAEDGQWYTVWSGSDADLYNKYAGQQVIIEFQPTQWGPNIKNVRLPDPVAEDTPANSEQESREQAEGEPMTGDDGEPLPF